MEVVVNKQEEKPRNLRYEMRDISLEISWRAIARRYFGKSAAWLYHRLDGTDVNQNGKPVQFTEEEKQILKGALCDMSERLRKASEII